MKLLQIDPNTVITLLSIYELIPLAYNTNCMTKHIEQIIKHINSVCIQTTSLTVTNAYDPELKCFPSTE